jgi:hypothetical protein
MRAFSAVDARLHDNVAGEGAAFSPAISNPRVAWRENGERNRELGYGRSGADGSAPSCL